MRCDFLRELDDHCPAPATVRLVYPAHHLTGGAYCQAHGERVARLYREVCGEAWELRPLTDAERRIP